MDETPIALITGANRGLGLEATRQLIAEGFHVIMAARDRNKAQAARADVDPDASRTTLLALDVTADADIRQAVETVEAEFGRLDVLVNNAGVSYWEDPLELTAEVLKATYATNVFAPFAMMMGFRPLLANAKSPRVINVSSHLGSMAIASDRAHVWYGLNVPAYNSSKTALNMLSLSYAKAFEADGIAVVAVCPGWTKTDMGGTGADREVADGAAIITQMAVAADVPNGQSIADDGPVAW